MTLMASGRREFVKSVLALGGVAALGRSRAGDGTVTASIASEVGTR